MLLHKQFITKHSTEHKEHIPVYIPPGHTTQQIEILYRIFRIILHA